MAKTTRKKHRDIELVCLTDEMSTKDIQRAYARVNTWVIRSSEGQATLYSIALSNLARRRQLSETASASAVRERLARGLDQNAFERLSFIAGVANEQLCKAVRISMRTISRRKVFEPDQSDRILRVAAAFQKTLEVLGDLELARRWFTRPKKALDGKTPLEFCDTDVGAEEVRNLLGRIDHGVLT